MLSPKAYCRWKEKDRSSSRPGIDDYIEHGVGVVHCRALCINMRNATRVQGREINEKELPQTPTAWIHMLALVCGRRHRRCSSKPQQHATTAEATGCWETPACA
jgi:hypothetical protein